MTTKEYPKDLNIGVPILDSQHREIIEKVKSLIQVIETKGTKEEVLESFNCFLSYIKHHFDTEEKYFDLFDYKDKLRHVTAHQIFFSTLVELEKNYSEDNTKIDEYMFYFLEKWSNTHVLSLDLELAKELINNKVV